MDEFDPVGLLESQLGQRSQGVNTSSVPRYPDTSFPAAKSLTHVSKTQSIQEDILSSGNVVVSSTLKLAYQSGPDIVPVFGTEQNFLTPSHDESSSPAPLPKNVLPAPAKSRESEAAAERNKGSTSSIVEGGPVSEVSATKRSVVEVPQASVSGAPLIAAAPTTDIGRQLWNARISFPKDKEDRQSKNELQQIIKQVSSIEFKPQDQAPAPLIVVERISEVEPNEITSGKKVPQEQLSRKLPNEQITEQTLQIFKNLSQHPEQLQNPFELAEILFNSCCLQEAAKCYQEALKRTTVDGADQFQNKAWLLFQIGNCLQNSDPPTAVQMYRQLITECPNSPWIDYAKAKSKLIEWYINDKPKTLINENKL